ncbi:MAG: hypothetical protein Q7T59_02805 [Candidatus Woesebacteria bacterium]|nr:hypothetical protein [Candidatus Woesebacteria bacterium]
MNKKVCLPGVADERASLRVVSAPQLCLPPLNPAKKPLCSRTSYPGT